MKRSWLNKNNLKTNVKKPRKKTISKVKKEAWKEFSTFIRRRDNSTCFTCGRRAESSGLHSGHFIPRSISSYLFFDERNVHAQCYRCNIHLSGNSDEYAQRLERKYGQGILEELRRDKYKVKQWSVKELEELRDKYKKLNS